MLTQVAGMLIAAATGFVLVAPARAIVVAITRPRTKVTALWMLALAPIALFVAIGLIVAFGAVANADAASKATMLAKGISELLNCTPFMVPALLGAAAAFLVPTPPRRPPADPAS